MTHTQLTQELIVDLLIEPKPTHTICAQHNLTLHELAEILESDAYQQLESDLTRIERNRAPALRRKLIASLETIANQTPTSPTHTEIIRKATTQLLRLLNTREPDSHPQNETETEAETHQQDRPTNNQANTHPDQQHTRPPGRDAAAESTTPHEHRAQSPQPDRQPERQSPRIQKKRNNKARNRKR